MAIELEIKGNSSKARADLARLNKSLVEVESNTSKISKSFSRLNTTLLSIAGSVGLGVLATQAVGVASNFERMSAQLDTVLGSAKATATAFKEINRIVAETPFDVGTLVDAYARLSSAEIADVPGRLQNIADLTAAIGGSSYDLERISALFTKVASEGKLTGETIGQLVDNRIPLNVFARAIGDVIGEVGLSVSRLRELTTASKISSEDVIGALKLLGEGRYAGAAARQVDTIAGAFSNLKDALTTFADNAIRVSGANSVIVNSTKKLTAVVLGASENIANQVSMAMIKTKLAFSSFETRVRTFRKILAEGDPQELVKFYFSEGPFNSLAERVKKLWNKLRHELDLNFSLFGVEINVNYMLQVIEHFAEEGILAVKRMRASIGESIDGAKAKWDSLVPDNAIIARLDGFIKRFNVAMEDLVQKTPSLPEWITQYLPQSERGTGTAFVLGIKPKVEKLLELAPLVDAATPLSNAASLLRDSAADLSAALLRTRDVMAARRLAQGNDVYTIIESAIPPEIQSFFMTDWSSLFGVVADSFKGFFTRTAPDAAAAAPKLQKQRPVGLFPNFPQTDFPFYSGFRPGVIEPLEERGVGATLKKLYDMLRPQYSAADDILTGSNIESRLNLADEARTYFTAEAVGRSSTAPSLMELAKQVAAMAQAAANLEGPPAPVPTVVTSFSDTQVDTLAALFVKGINPLIDLAQPGNPELVKKIVERVTTSNREFEVDRSFVEELASIVPEQTRDNPLLRNLVAKTDDGLTRLTIQLAKGQQATIDELKKPASPGYQAALRRIIPTGIPALDEPSPRLQEAPTTLRGMVEEAFDPRKWTWAGIISDQIEKEVEKGVEQSAFGDVVAEELEAVKEAITPPPGAVGFWQAFADQYREMESSLLGAKIFTPSFWKGVFDKIIPDGLEKIGSPPKGLLEPTKTVVEKEPGFLEALGLGDIVKKVGSALTFLVDVIGDFLSNLIQFSSDSLVLLSDMRLPDIRGAIEGFFDFSDIKNPLDSFSVANLKDFLDTTALLQTVIGLVTGTLPILLLGLTRTVIQFIQGGGALFKRSKEEFEVSLGEAFGSFATDTLNWRKERGGLVPSDIPSGAVNPLISGERGQKFFQDSVRVLSDRISRALELDTEQNERFSRLIVENLRLTIPKGEGRTDERDKILNNFGNLLKDDLLGLAAQAKFGFSPKFSALQRAESLIESRPRVAEDIDKVSDRVTGNLTRALKVSKVSLEERGVVKEDSPLSDSLVPFFSGIESSLLSQQDKSKALFASIIASNFERDVSFSRKLIGAITEIALVYNPKETLKVLTAEPDVSWGERVVDIVTLAFDTIIILTKEFFDGMKIALLALIGTAPLSLVVGGLTRLKDSLEEKQLKAFTDIQSKVKTKVAVAKVNNPALDIKPGTAVRLEKEVLKLKERDLALKSRLRAETSKTPEGIERRLRAVQIRIDRNLKSVTGAQRVPALQELQDELVKALRKAQISAPETNAKVAAIRGEQSSLQTILSIRTKEAQAARLATDALEKLEKDILRSANRGPFPTFVRSLYTAFDDLFLAPTKAAFTTLFPDKARQIGARVSEQVISLGQKVPQVRPFLGNATIDIIEQRIKDSLGAVKEKSPGALSKVGTTLSGAAKNNIYEPLKNLINKLGTASIARFTAGGTGAVPLAYRASKTLAGATARLIASPYAGAGAKVAGAGAGLIRVTEKFAPGVSAFFSTALTSAFKTVSTNIPALLGSGFALLGKVLPKTLFGNIAFTLAATFGGLFNKFASSDIGERVAKLIGKGLIVIPVLIVGSMVAAIPGILKALMGVGKFIINLFTGMIELIVDLIRIVFSKDFMMVLFNLVSNFIGSLIDLLLTIPSIVAEAFGKVFKKIGNAFTEDRVSSVPGNKDGGYITGPGTGTSDSILRYLSNGEYVINAESTKKHRPLLEAINSGNSPLLPADEDEDEKVLARVSNGEFIVSARNAEKNKELLDKINAPAFRDGGIVGYDTGGEVVTRVSSDDKNITIGVDINEGEVKKSNSYLEKIWIGIKDVVAAAQEQDYNLNSYLINPQKPVPVTQPVEERSDEEIKAELAERIKVATGLTEIAGYLDQAKAKWKALVENFGGGDKAVTQPIIRTENDPSLLAFIEEINKTLKEERKIVFGPIPLSEELQGQLEGFKELALDAQDALAADPENASAKSALADAVNQIRRLSLLTFDREEANRRAVAAGLSRAEQKALERERDKVLRDEETLHEQRLAAAQQLSASVDDSQIEIQKYQTTLNELNNLYKLGYIDGERYVEILKTIDKQLSDTLNSWRVKLEEIGRSGAESIAGSFQSGIERWIGGGAFDYKTILASVKENIDSGIAAGIAEAIFGESGLNITEKLGDWLGKGTQGAFQATRVLTGQGVKEEESIARYFNQGEIGDFGNQFDFNDIFSFDSPGDSKFNFAEPSPSLGLGRLPSSEEEEAQLLNLPLPETSDQLFNWGTTLGSDIDSAIGSVTYGIGTSLEAQSELLQPTISSVFANIGGWMKNAFTTILGLFTGDGGSGVSKEKKFLAGAIQIGASAFSSYAGGGFGGGGKGGIAFDASKIDFDYTQMFADGGTVKGMNGQPTPIIAHAGEVVLNKAQQHDVANKMSGAADGSTSINHNNFNFSGVPDPLFVKQIENIIARSGGITDRSSKSYQTSKQGLNRRRVT